MLTTFCVQHYDRRGQYDIALSKIDEAIKHTPTVIDLYSVKVRQNGENNVAIDYDYSSSCCLMCENTHLLLKLVVLN